MEPFEPVRELQTHRMEAKADTLIATKILKVLAISGVAPDFQTSSLSSTLLEGLVMAYTYHGEQCRESEFLHLLRTPVGAQNQFHTTGNSYHSHHRLLRIIPPLAR